ncbi:hypothetical protein Zmor_010463 [Zophobas morio]|uniref:PHD-type domain-containing protein n=1 Tax=Zophobas morio TaxID=2755281 RepID=A0AA38IKT3_9CUCU|nr:hypothetical protein Zmor_010463 [Zophobas morio]
MEELQTDTLSDYGKSQHQDLDINKDNENGAANLLNGCEEVDDPLDLMADNCDNVSIASNSDVWKGSDSEDDNFESKESPAENESANRENEKESDKTVSINDKQSDVATDGTIAEKETSNEDKNKVVENNTKIDDAETKQGVEGNSKVDDATTKQSAEDSSIIESEEQIEAEQPEKASDEVVDKETTEGVHEAENKEKDISETENKEKESESNDKVENNTDNVDNSVNEQEKPADVAATVEALVSSVAESVPTSPKEAAEEITTDKDSVNEVAADKEPVVNGDKDPPTEEPNKDTAEDGPPNRYTSEQDDECQMDYDAEDDDDFDPSLLCPEVSMAVDDNPVVTTNGGVPNETGIDSPLPYEPVFSTFVDDVTGAEISFNLTPEELELKKRLYGPTNPVQFTRIHCTACNVHLGSALEGQNNRFVHPLLKVIICKECYHFYTSGEFEKDEDGSELYCRWCGQGGQVVCCSKCEFVFCKRCIRTNFGRKKMFEIRDSDNWDCFRCNQSQIITQRIACYEFFEYVRREMSLAATLPTSEIWSKDYSRCCGAKKRAAENAEETKKAKKRKSETDPDYNPLAEKVVDESNAASTIVANPLATSTPRLQMPTLSKGIVLPKPIKFVPRYTMSKAKDNDIEFVRQIPAPHVTVSATTRPTYRTILPTPGNAARAGIFLFIPVHTAVQKKSQYSYS